MKRVLLINGSFLNNSGCGVIAKHTYDILRLKGYDAEIYTAKGRSGISNYKYEGLFIEPYNTPKRYITNFFDFYYNQKSKKNISVLLDDFKPDIVHVHSLQTSALTYSVLEPCIKRNIPIVMTLHDSFLVCPVMTLMKSDEKYCYGINCKGLNKLPCIRYNCAGKLEASIRFALMSFIYNITGYNKYISKFITPSNALKDLILKSKLGINNDRLITINNFISDDELQTLPNYNNNGYFLYIGRLSKEKGVHYLLEAMKDLPKNINLRIIGTGPEEIFLKKYTADNNLNNVKFLGFKNREEIKEEYKNCIATILPCNGFEIFGMTNVESFINGKPVIASNIGGIPEIVENNINGLLFEPGNVDQLRECILRYWNNPQLVIEHGKNAYHKAITNYTADVYYEKLIQLYKNILTEEPINANNR